MFAFLNIAGYTGTQQGMNHHQKKRFTAKIVEMAPDEFHHGDCIGGDEEAHYIVQEHLPNCRIIIHPPLNESKRAFCRGAHLILPAKDYIPRNHDIVSAVTKMFVTPFEDEEQLRSGTWATYRFTRKLDKPFELILPKRN